MKVSDWRKQKKAEEGAGFLEEQHLYQGKLECVTCGIYIGKDHHEQELYLWPVFWGEEVKLADAYKTFKHLMVFSICGGCADKRGIADDLDLQVFDHRIWQTENTIARSRLGEIGRRFQEEVCRVLLFSYWLRSLFKRVLPWAWWCQWISPILLSPVPVTLVQRAEPVQIQAAAAYTADISHLLAGMHASSLLPYAS